MIITLKASSFQNGSQLFWCFGVRNWSIILFSRIIVNVIILKQLVASGDVKIGKYCYYSRRLRQLIVNCPSLQNIGIFLKLLSLTCCNFIFLTFLVPYIVSFPLFTVWVLYQKYEYWMYNTNHTYCKLVLFNAHHY